jgi:hypothetical protein
MKFRKYEFSSVSEWETMKSYLPYDSNGMLLYTSKELGFLPITQATYDEQGISTPAVLSTNYSVDIIWHEDTVPSQFTQYEVWPAGVGCHTFLGMDDLYRKEYNERK